MLICIGAYVFKVMYRIEYAIEVCVELGMYTIVRMIGIDLGGHAHRACCYYAISELRLVVPLSAHQVVHTLLGNVLPIRICMHNNNLHIEAAAGQSKSYTIALHCARS